MTLFGMEESLLQMVAEERGTYSYKTLALKKKVKREDFWKQSKNYFLVLRSEQTILTISSTPRRAARPSV